MTSDNIEIKLLARLRALEIVIQDLLVVAASRKDDPVAELKACRNRLLRAQSHAPLKGVEPAMSELVAQDLTEALDALLSEAIAQSRESRPPQSADFSPRSRR